MIMLAATEKLKFQLSTVKMKLFLNIISTFHTLIVNCSLQGVTYQRGYLYYFFIF